MNCNKKFLFFNIFFLLVSLINSAHKDNEVGDINEKNENKDDFFSNLDFSTVVKYDDKNYIERIKNDKPLFMYVYSPSCIDCQKTIPIFISLSDFLKKNKTDVTMARVNAQENPEFSKDYKIKDFPTLSYIGRDRIVLEYKYEITRYNLLRFLVKKIYGDTLNFETMAEVNKTVADKKYKKHQVFVLSTLAFEHKKEIFNKYAHENDREIFIHCFSIECYNEYNEDIVIYKDFDEKVILYSDHFKSGADRLDIEKVRKFVMRYSVEAGGLLENEFFLLAKDYKRKMIIYFRDSNDTNQIQYDKVIKEAGLELRKKVGYTFVSDIKGDEFYQKVAEDFVIAKHELPTLLYVDKINLKERHKCKTYRINNLDLSKLNRDFVLKFVKDVQKNKYYRDLRTEFPVEEDINDNNKDTPFKKIIGRTYDKEVINQKKNILIAFVDMKNACELCYKYLDVMKEYKEKSQNDFVYAYIDGSKNEARGISFTENDLPFIYFYTNGESNKSKYKFKPKDEEKINKENLELFITEALKGNDVKEDL